MYQRLAQHQMRRHIRKMRRYGLQPMTVNQSRRPLPEPRAQSLG